MGLETRPAGTGSKRTTGVSCVEVASPAAAPPRLQSLFVPLTGQGPASASASWLRYGRHHSRHHVSGMRCEQVGVSPVSLFKVLPAQEQTSPNVTHSRVSQCEGDVGRAGDERASHPSPHLPLAALPAGCLHFHGRGTVQRGSQLVPRPAAGTWQRRESRCSWAPDRTLSAVTLT